MASEPQDEVEQAVWAAAFSSAYVAIAAKSPDFPLTWQTPRHESCCAVAGSAVDCLRAAKAADERKRGIPA